MTFPRLLVLLCLLPRLNLLGAGDATGSILPNGNLENSDTGRSWALSKGASIEEEGGNHFLRLQADAPNEQIQAYQKVVLPGGVQDLTVSFRVRFSDITPGAENWHTGRVVLHFKDAAGQIVKPDPAPVAFKGNSNGWLDKTIPLRVPEGAVSLEFMAALFQVAAGALDLDDILVTPSAAPASGS